MKYRWRGTWLLSFLLTGLILSRIVNEWINWNSGTLRNVLIENLVFGIPLIASFVIIFVLSSRTVHEKITNKRFPKKWLIKYNLSLFVKVFVAFEIIGTALIFALIKTQTLLNFNFSTMYYWILYAPLIALSAILVFSFIPSIILLRTHPDKKTRKIIFISFIVLTLLIFVTSFVSIFNCQFGYAGKCLALTAINKEDISFCDNGLTEGNKEKCYNYVIFHGGLELTEDFCKTIPRLTENCLMKFAMETNEPEFCGGDDGCIGEIALQTKDINLCKTLNSTEDYQELRRNGCILGVAIKTKNGNLCDEMTSNHDDNRWINELCISLLK